MKIKNFLKVSGVVSVLVLGCAAVLLYERSKIAMIIDDEAAWDVRDSLSYATRMKVIILPGMAQVLCEPDPAAGVKCDIIYEEGMCPDTYRCLGLDDGWYEISLREGGSGFIQAHLMSWDAIDTF